MRRPAGAHLSDPPERRGRRRSSPSLSSSLALLCAAHATTRECPSIRECLSSPTHLVLAYTGNTRRPSQYDTPSRLLCVYTEQSHHTLEYDILSCTHLVLCTTEQPVQTPSLVPYQPQPMLRNEYNGKRESRFTFTFPCPEYHQIFPSDIAAAGNIIHPPSNNSTRENNHATSPCAFRQQGWPSLSTSHRRHLTFITSKYP
jgi:hypothetical protein